VLDLVKINADLGRFGGLIKMWLTTNADFESISARSLQRKLEKTLSDVRLLHTKISKPSRRTLNHVFRAGVPRPGDAGELTFVGLRSDDIKKGRNENSGEEPVWQACGAILFRRVLLNHQLGPVRCA
jgi:hypothetical protein